MKLKFCDACEQPMESVFAQPDSPNLYDKNVIYTIGEEEGPDFIQYENALIMQGMILQFDGGYGMFVDDFELGLDKGYFGPRLIICHDCAHKLCRDNPWIDKYIQALTSHTHRTKYIEEHPEHYGADYD